MGLSSMVAHSRIAAALAISKLVVWCWFSTPLKEKLKYTDIAAWLFLAGVLNVCCPGAPLIPKIRWRHGSKVLSIMCVWYVYRFARFLLLRFKAAFIDDSYAELIPSQITEGAASLIYIVVVSILTAMVYFTRNITDAALFVAADKTTMMTKEKRRKSSSFSTMPRALTRLQETEVWNQRRSAQVKQRKVVDRRDPVVTRSGEQVPSVISQEYVTFVNAIRLDKDLPESYNKP